MKLHEIKQDFFSKPRKRIGRGTSSNHGKTCGKGQKGQKVRTHPRLRVGFEGGQTPIFRRLPKFGFYHKKTQFKILNLNQIEKFSFVKINNQTLFENKIIKNIRTKVKILGNGNISKALEVDVFKISKTAQDLIIKANGKIIKKNCIKKND